MDLTVKIGFEEVMKLVKQLPAGKIKELQSLVNEDFISKKAKEEITSFQDFLLEGPVMSKKDLELFQQNRKSFSEWRMRK